LQFYCIEYFKNYVLGLPTQKGIVALWTKMYFKTINLN
jgi:hypothetical protein